MDGVSGTMGCYSQLSAGLVAQLLIAPSSLEPDVQRASRPMGLETDSNSHETPNEKVKGESYCLNLMWPIEPQGAGCNRCKSHDGGTPITTIRGICVFSWDGIPKTRD